MLSNIKTCENGWSCEVLRFCNIHMLLYILIKKFNILTYYYKYSQVRILDTLLFNAHFVNAQEMIRDFGKFTTAFRATVAKTWSKRFFVLSNFPLTCCSGGIVRLFRC